jgi:hypothetical protein
MVQIGPESQQNDSPTYTILPCQARAWERQSKTRIACLASVRHTGQVCPTTSAEHSSHTHRCPHGTSTSNLPPSSALRQMQHSFLAASAATKGPTVHSVSSPCNTCAASHLLQLRDELHKLGAALMRCCLCWSQHARLSRCARSLTAVSSS